MKGFWSWECRQFMPSLLDHCWQKFTAGQRIYWMAACTNLQSDGQQIQIQVEIKIQIQTHKIAIASPGTLWYVWLPLFWLHVCCRCAKHCAMHSVLTVISVAVLGTTCNCIVLLIVCGSNLSDYCGHVGWVKILRPDLVIQSGCQVNIVKSQGQLNACCPNSKLRT